MVTRPTQDSSIAAPAPAPASPSGTVTFLFTDVEASTRLWEQRPAAMQAALTRHDALLRSSIEGNGGHLFKTMGDACCAAFATAPDALAAAIDAQYALHEADWGAGEMGPLRVRMALHTGAVEQRDGDYFGPPLNRVARLLAAGHGGQVLLSEVAAGLVRDSLLDQMSLRDLGAHRLKDLQRPERVFQLVLPPLPADFPPLRTLERHPNNLPALATPLVGREQEVAAVLARLRQPEVRLLTLTGPGGTGKTRLALQVAAECLEEFAHGVCFVPLAPVTNPDLVAAALAQTLGVREAGARPVLDLLHDYLRDKHLLLVLDNFEQVVGAAPLVAGLLATCPQVKVLVTSRAVLHVYGEHDRVVPPLTVPDLQHLPSPARLTQYEAVRLFVERAQAAHSDFAVTNENAPAVAEICHRLDGLPLAIELAAARSRLFPPQALLTRLEHRLPLLTGGARDLPARQQTLRKAIAWSYDLLDPAEQALFRRLAVFAGGCTLEAAEAVCSAAGEQALDVVDGLDSLVGKSLLKQEEQAGGEPRFTMLETIREFALERLAASGEAAGLRRHHAAQFLALAERADPELRGPVQVSWLERLEREHANLREALAWALEYGDGEMGLRLAGALWSFWHLRGDFAEGRRWLEALVQRRRAAPTACWANALAKAGFLAWAQGDHAVARAHVEESLAFLHQVGDQRGIALALFVLGSVVWVQGDYARARSLGEENLALCRELGDTWHTALTLHGLGSLARLQGDYAVARNRCEESLALFRALGDKQGIAWSLYGLGEVATDQGDYAVARARCQESLALFRALGDKWGIAWSLHDLGEVAAIEGDHALARAFQEESLALFRDLGDKPGIAWSLYNLGRVARDQGDYTLARALQEESLALRRELGDQFGIAGSLHGLGSLAWAQGDHAVARALFAQSLTLQREVGDQRGIAECLEGLAGVCAAERQPGRAARLLGAAEQLRETLGTPLPPADRAGYDRIVASVLAHLEPAAVAAAWAEGRTLPLDRTIASALETAGSAAA